LTGPLKGKNYPSILPNFSSLSHGGYPPALFFQGVGLILVDPDSSFLSKISPRVFSFYPPGSQSGLPPQAHEFPFGQCSMCPDFFPPQTPKSRKVFTGRGPPCFYPPGGFYPLQYVRSGSYKDGPLLPPPKHRWSFFDYLTPFFVPVLGLEESTCVISPSKRDPF